MSGGGVFINYRATDSFYAADLLFVGLTAVVGMDRVFLDSESIEPGADFVDALTQRVRDADIVLAVIGPTWLTAVGPDGGRLIDDPTDWIRRELAEAFDAGVLVVPILTDRAVMPTEADLPVDIARLGRAQYLWLRQRAARADLGLLVDRLTGLIAAAPPEVRPSTPTPRQLPASTCLFAGRTDELAMLTSALGHATVVISAIGGAGGIGKTALALHWAHQHAWRFADGQLYVNLRGFDVSDEPLSPDTALYSFLVALGVDPARVPAGLDVRSGLYRSLVAGRRMLIVLDNARFASQVVPLLPGTPTCSVLVTSRRHLDCLVATHGARLLHLDVLPESESIELLAQHLGARRLAAEPNAVVELLKVCAGFPLALRIVAARLARHSHFPLAVMAAELRDAPTRLDGLDAGDLHTNIRTVLSWSYHALGAAEATVFEFLSLTPGPDISLPAIASLTDLPCGRVRTLLRELETASLVQEYKPEFYRMHDLIRLYAAEQAERHLSIRMRCAALRRLVDFYRNAGRGYQERLIDFSSVDGSGLPSALINYRP